MSTVALDNEQIVQYLFLATEQAVICESVIFSQLSPCIQDFGVLCPDPCLNICEFYYPPVAYTGHFRTQGDPTVPCAHCALGLAAANHQCVYTRWQQEGGVCLKKVLLQRIVLLSSHCEVLL